MSKPPFFVGDRVRLPGEGLVYIVRAVERVTPMLPTAAPYWRVEAEEARGAGGRAKLYAPADELVRA